MREVLSHTSGLPFSSPLEQPTLDGLPLRVAVRSYAMSPLQFPPGSNYQYANAGINSAALVVERVGHFLAHYGARHGIVVGSIAIRNQKSRWGSCSKKGNLNFNYKLVFLPPELRDYVIVHEICHVKEFNHGKPFWALVGEAVPDYREMRRRLRNVK